MSDRFRGLVESAGDGIVILNFSEGRVLDANRAACELWGYTLDELRDLDTSALYPVESQGAISDLNRELLRNGRVWHPNLRMQRRTGETFYGEVRFTVYGPPERRLAAAIVRDVSERLDREAELRRSYDALQDAQRRLARSEEKYRTLVEAASDAIIILDAESRRFVEVNRAACELFEYDFEEFRMLGETRLFPKSDRGRGLRLIRHEQGFTPNVRMRRKDGSTFWAEVHAADYSVGGKEQFMAIIRDVTWRVEREQEIADSYKVLEETQAKLVQASKLSAMGELGAGIAHELNQPITIIQGFAQRLRRRSTESIEAHLDEIDIIVDEAGRMARIVDNIRTFARQSDFKPEPIDPLRPLTNAIELLGAQLKVRGIQVSLESTQPLPEVNADTARLQQVFLNLIVNSRDALADLPPESPKKLWLRVEQKGRTLDYIVEDNGPGVPPELEERVFEPFYTSKPPGEGTGLGLSIAYGIVKDHDGEIRLESSEAGGARFVVSLPILRELDSTEP
jgi:histidine kinase